MSPKASQQRETQRFIQAEPTRWITSTFWAVEFSQTQFTHNNTICNLYLPTAIKPHLYLDNIVIVFTWQEASSPAPMTARWLLSTSSVTHLRSAEEDANLLPRRFPTSQLSLRWRWRRRKPQVSCSFLPVNKHTCSASSYIKNIKTSLLKTVTEGLKPIEKQETWSGFCSIL